MGCASTKPPPTNLTASSKSAAYAAQLRARQAALHNLSSTPHAILAPLFTALQHKTGVFTRHAAERGESASANGCQRSA